MHRAAELLNLSQPAASKLLKDLEDSLGLELFERLPRGMKPTPYGETMIRHARTALNSLNQAHEELMAAKLGQLGQVRIGSITAPSVALLPPTLSAVKQAHPDLQLMVQVDPSNVLVDALLRSQLDIVIGRLSQQHDKSAFRYEMLADEPVSAVVRPDHPLLHAAGLDLATALQYGWIIPPSGTILRHHFDLMLQKLQLPMPASSVVTSSLLFSTKILKETDLICLMASDTAHYYAENGVVARLPLDLPCDMEPFGFITLRDAELSPAAQVVLRSLQSVASTVYGSQYKNQYQ